MEDVATATVDRIVNEVRSMVWVAAGDDLAEQQRLINEIVERLRKVEPRVPGDEPNA